MIEWFSKLNLHKAKIKQMEHLRR